MKNNMNEIIDEVPVQLREGAGRLRIRASLDERSVLRLESNACCVLNV